MTMGKRSDLTVSQRREVVLMLLRREEPAAKLASRFGVSEQTLYRWRDEFLAGGEAALSAGKGQHDPRQREIGELRKQLTQRDQVIGELTIANRILKKTADGLY
jgi:transposase-like protein